VNYAGGGNPAEALLKYIKTRFVNFSIKDFTDIATRLNRYDIVELFTKYNIDDMNSKLTGIPYLLEREICDCLFDDWKAFAEELEFEEDVITAFGNTICQNGMEKPTEGLITMIKQTYPRYKLCKLSQDLSEIGREDAKLYVDGLLKEFIEYMLG